MRSQVKERASSGTCHEFDSISTNCEIEVRPARRAELSILADMAHRLVPGVQIAEPVLGKYLAFDPECILTFSRQQRLLGGMAFLYLNNRGHDALILDEISLTHPDIGLLAACHQEVSAIYIWAIAATGRGIAGLGNAAAHLRKPRYVDADCFAHPSTTAGRDLLGRNRLQTDTKLSARSMVLRATLELPSSDDADAMDLIKEPRRCTAVNRYRRSSRSCVSISIRIARDPNDLMLVTAIRAAVYLAEQDCPIEEEFDGNDLVAAHFLGFVGSEPAGCLRVRFFGEFAKVERLAVRHQFRRSRVSFKLVQASVDYIKRKGFRKIYGQAQDRLVDFWAHFGAKPLGHNRKITFSDFSYTEMVLDIEPGPDAITLDSDPYVIIRPEGDWDRPGVLDISAGRSATSPLRRAALAET